MNIRRIVFKILNQQCLVIHDSNPLNKSFDLADFPKNELIHSACIFME